MSGNHQKPEALHFDRWQDARIQTFDHQCHRHRRHDTSSDHPQGFCQAAKMMMMMMMMMMMLLMLMMMLLMMMMMMILTVKRYYKSLEHIIVIDDKDYLSLHDDETKPLRYLQRSINLPRWHRGYFTCRSASWIGSIKPGARVRCGGRPQ